MQAQARLRVLLPDPSILTSAQKQELRTLVDRRQGQLRWDIESCRQWFGRVHKLLQEISQTPPSAMSDAQRTALVAEIAKAEYEVNTRSGRILIRSSILSTSSFGTAQAARQQQIAPSMVPTSFRDTVRAAMQQQIAPSMVPTSFRDRVRAAMQQQIAPSSIMLTSSYDTIRKVQRPDSIGGI
jgi:hypothetical protein